MPRHKLIVGLDYGTTFTGVSFVPSNKASAKDIHVVRTWPEKDGEWKVPSRIAYPYENEKYELGSTQWGFQVQPELKACSWTKLLLDSKTPATQYDDPNLRTAKADGHLHLPSGKGAQQVAADYLGEVYSYVRDRIRKHIGDTFDSTPVECWVTVPAVWSEQAQSATRSAALQAGFGARPGDSINIITEPEAAGVTVIDEITRSNTIIKPKQGENVMICDCGGGTVDIISYTIRQVSPYPTFAEVCEGIGAKCGSTSIDRELDKLLVRRFGSAWKSVKASRRGNFLRRWEDVKKSFNGDTNGRPQRLGPVFMDGVPNSEFYDDEDGFVLLSGKDIKDVFDPTVEQVIGLVEQQRDMIRAQGKRLDRLVLVGGFGDSPYLYQRLKDWCQRNGGISAYCPEHPQAAIVTGAALRGLLNMSPESKKCRKHYGCPIGMKFREGIDPKDKLYYPHYGWDAMCSNRMMWLVKKALGFLKGDDITKDTIRKHPYRSEQRKKDKDKDETLQLCSSNSDVPPEHVEDDSVDIVGSIHLDLNGVDISKYKARREFWIIGSKYLEIPVDVQVHFGSKTGRFQVDGVCEGEITGTATIEYE
ncbi:hypothetical protein M409DRAFT_25826 [Zasmidium cellare ATCC 36951]|uniref:Actin-like ATPase domain-containing protein n=1 Tax=Zasmidium cellare ATCC 36951 TaxID=1080233 RepID=A0A6A6CBQ7_ZASCE|nr:uncharacterized protein M409DRAFT_25826 [Zasmidium cellare ATCC 36951]KAF2163638.1 hypothetical protein M409DRAFT_25826 [Zasmidium cellare ATCC 36951]